MIRIVYNKLLRGWFVVRGAHHFPLAGPFDTKEAARTWLATPHDERVMIARRKIRRLARARAGLATGCNNR